MITIKLKLKVDLKEGIKDIFDNENNPIKEVIFDTYSPLIWHITEVNELWSTMTNEEKEIESFKKEYESKRKDSDISEDILITIICVNINNGQYTVYMTGMDKYNKIFKTN